jgi:cell division septation protein DedD
MVEKRRRQREEVGPGWLYTLGGAALLMVLGFGVGLVAGAAWEEPDLVMAHLTGRTTEVPLADASSPDPVEAEDREFPARPPGTREEPPEERGSGSEVDPPSVSAPPPTRAPAPPPEAGGFAVQVGAFGDEEAASRLAGELRAAGFSVYIRSGETSRGVRFRVRVGPVPTREKATRLAAKLKSDHQLPTWILSQDSH